MYRTDGQTDGQRVKTVNSTTNIVLLRGYNNNNNNNNDNSDNNNKPKEKWKLFSFRCNLGVDYTLSEKRL